jgi:hypothetical protein
MKTTTRTIFPAVALLSPNRSARLKNVCGHVDVYSASARASLFHYVTRETHRTRSHEAFVFVILLICGVAAVSLAFLA